MNTVAKHRKKQSDQFSAFYDKYAGVIYGLIMSMVDDQLLAEKILLKVFRDAFVHNNLDAPKLNSRFIAVTNHARKRSQDTNRAISIFRACNEGRPCISVRKKDKSTGDGG
jgi:hypothetical protein